MIDENTNITDEEIKNTIAVRINELMRNKNYDKDVTVYENTGISQGRFSNIRNKKAIPTVSQLYELAKFFDVPMEYLIDKSVRLDNKRVISWKEISYRELISILISMEDNGFIKAITNYEEYQDEYDTIYSPAGTGFIFDDGYITNKLDEWKSIIKPFENYEHDYDWDFMQYLKKGFLESVKDEVLVDDKELPFD